MIPLYPTQPFPPPPPNPPPPKKKKKTRAVTKLDNAAASTLTENSILYTDGQTRRQAIKHPI